MSDTPITSAEFARGSNANDSAALRFIEMYKVSKKLEVENTRMLSLMASLTVPVGFSTLQEKFVLLEVENARLREILELISVPVGRDGIATPILAGGITDMSLRRRMEIENANRKI